MKNGLFFCTVLLSSFLGCYAMEDMPKELRVMCEGKDGGNKGTDGVAYHCNVLKKFFFCARALNDGTQRASSYCDHVMGYDKESLQRTYPDDWHISYHVKELCEASKVDDPADVVNYIAETKAALSSFKVDDPVDVVDTIAQAKAALSSFSESSRLENPFDS